MKQQKGVLRKLYEKTDLLYQPLPGVPVVELAGDRRVLVERHQGVTEYGTSRICIQVKYGQLCVCGDTMELVLMTGEQLVITGRIDSITLLRGGNG